ncbi:kinesin-like protein KIF12 [Tachypleus tridentatus]|uniref:kinesin-like protein KIF12 n=1 Tax=Tachypleus tridentatus TaxID=6853 RepID=UPI003FCF6D19
MYSNVPSTASSQESLMSLSSDEGQGGSDLDNINVVVRVRPLASHEVGKKDIQAVQFPGEGQIMVDDQINGQSRVYTFNVVFEPEASQEDVFEFSGLKRLVDMALDGFACTVLAYGQTGAGKTYTLTGPQKEDAGASHEPGVINLAFSYLYEGIKQRKSEDFVIHSSYLEIYNEHVLDLLNPSPKHLPVRWSKDKGFYAENLFAVECEDEGDLQGVLEEGKKNRQVRSHNMNEHSSRSHTLLVLTLTAETRDPDDPHTFIRRQGKLSLVDLAGSEKTKKTNSKGETLVEANNINKSLLVLGNCISALADPRKRSGHIPYRDSCLTKLLAESLGGGGMALMIACVSPSRTNAPETISTLRYASRAKRIKTKPIVRMDPREQLIMSLKREVKLLRMENTYLRQQTNLVNGINVIMNQGGREITIEDGSIGNQKELEKDLTTMVANYMQENENLRAENAQLHQMRELLIRDHELVCKENERLMKKIADMEQGLVQSPTHEEDRQNSRSASTVPSATTFGNSGLWKSLVSISKEEETEKPGSSNGERKPPHRLQQAVTPSKWNSGKSLIDLTENQEDTYSATQRKRRNSWGSGIPRNAGQGNRKTPLSSPANTKSRKNDENQPPEQKKLPPLFSKLFPRGNKKNETKTGPTKATRLEGTLENIEDMGNTEKNVEILHDNLHIQAKQSVLSRR